MARVTVEDCIEKIPNRFDLVLLAAQRSRELSNHGGLLVDRDNDKFPVVALREIADSDLNLRALSDMVANNLQRYRDQDEPDSLDDDEAFQENMEIAGEFDDALSEHDIMDNIANLDDELDDLNDELMQAEDEEPAMPQGMQFDDVVEDDEDER